MRSRLAEGKRKLAAGLLAAGSGGHEAVREQQLHQLRAAEQMLAEAAQGRFSRVAPELFDPQLTGPNAAWADGTCPARENAWQ
ncbi:MAG TPA: hypothetical protein VFS67_26910 [Polyangiaceae bacterium]|nr:hypothetical protein [Polyangiaceae bacterium]